MSSFDCPGEDLRFLNDTEINANNKLKNIVPQSVLDSNVVVSDAKNSYYSVRDKIVLNIGKNKISADALILKQKLISEQLTKQKINERVSVEQAKIGASDQLAEVLSDKAAFINQLSASSAQTYGALSAQTYGALSALAYEKFEEGSLSRTPKETQTSLAIQTQQKILENLEKYSLGISDILKTKPTKVAKEIASFVNTLKHTFGIDVPCQNKVNGISMYLQDDIISAIGEKSLALKTKISSLTELSFAEQADQINDLQKLLDQNKYAKGLQVQGIFYRNNGEFSGFAAYNEDTHQLSLVFAGSKSKSDWVKNLMGWNDKASARRGFLTGMNLHSGFLSHLEGLSDEAFRGAYRILDKLNAKHKDKPLEVVGTGHSLGGALATLFTACTKEMADARGMKINVKGCTFGAPNLVHGGSVDHMNKLFGGAGNWVRFENSYDPIPVACFWKDSPGLAIRYKQDFFYDTAGAMQIFGQNPHGMNNYYHGIETHMNKWKKSTEDLITVLNQREKFRQELQAVKSASNDHLKAGHAAMRELVDFDSLHVAELALHQDVHLEQLQAHRLESKKALEEMRAKIQNAAVATEGLSKVEYEAMESSIKRLVEQDKLTELMYEDAKAMNFQKIEAKTRKVQIKQFNALIGNRG